MIEHVPAVTKVNAPPEVIVQTPVVVELKLTANEDVAVAVPAKVGVVPKFLAPGFGKVMVCAPLGVAEMDAPEATLVPIPLAAVTVKV